MTQDLDPRIGAWDRTDRMNAVFLVGLLWVACFLKAGGFGAYEDDYVVVQHWETSFFDMLRHVGHSLLEWPQGRPFQGVGKTVFGYVAGVLGGFPAAFVLSYAVLAANALLIYAIVRRCAPAVAALAAAAIMILYPADATKMLIIRSAQVQLTMTIALIAIWLYLNDRRALSYAAIVGSIGLYEFGFLPFLFAPLLKIPAGRGAMREMGVHLAIMAAILAVALVVRLQFAPGRLDAALDLTLWEIVSRSAEAMAVGTYTSVRLSVLRPITAIEWRTTTSVIVMAVVFLVSVLMLWRGRPITASRARAAAAIQLTIVGGCMWVASYMLFFGDRFPPTARFNRWTSVHVPAEVGASVMAAGVVWLVLVVARRSWPWRAFAVTAALYFALLAGFQVNVQDGLVEARRQQEHFWQAALSEASDLTDGTLIVVDFDGRQPRNRLAVPLGWATPMVLPIMLRSPEEWGHEPTLLFLRQLRDRIVATADSPRFSELAWSETRPLPQGNVIWLRATDGGFARHFGTKRVAGIEIDLKPRDPATLDDIEKGTLYRFLGTP